MQPDQRPSSQTANQVLMFVSLHQRLTKNKNPLFWFFVAIRNQDFGLGFRIGDMAHQDEPNVELSLKMCARYGVFGL